MNQEKHLNMQIDSDPLNEVALSTGGVFVQSTNDMDGGIAKISGLDAAAYVLGFSPENLKPDGRFHTLKVRLARASNLSLQARRGYFAPRGAEAQAMIHREELEDAGFSHENLDGFPLQVSTKVAEMSGNTHKLQVIVDVDMHAAQFAKQGGRNVDDVTVEAVVFDADGNFVTATEQTVKMRLADEGLQKLRRSGGEAEMDLSLEPGSYVIRVVVGDTHSTELGATSKALKIP